MTFDVTVDERILQEIENMGTAVQAETGATQFDSLCYVRDLAQRAVDAEHERIRKMAKETLELAKANARALKVPLRSKAVV